MGNSLVKQLEQDPALLERLQQGDQDAIDEIVDRYQNPLFAFILRLVDDRQATEDIFQDTWLKVIRNLKSFRGEALFSTWLFKIALNGCRDYRRKGSLRVHVPLDLAESVEDHPAVEGEKLVQAEQVRKLVHSLPLKMREVVVLRYYHEKSEKEIAEVIGCPLGTVKTRLHRASQMMRSKIEALGLG